MKEKENQDLNPQNQGADKVDEQSKSKQLEAFREDPKEQYMTTDQGVRINHTDDSVKAGSRGPTLWKTSTSGKR